eukprot:g1083.t1
MEEEKYLTEQERVDNMTMKIDNQNLIGSGFIKHPPQERKPQNNFNDYGNRNFHHDGFNRRGGGGRYRHPSRGRFGPRTHYGSYRGGYNNTSGGRAPYRPYRDGPPRGYSPAQRPMYNSRFRGPIQRPQGDHGGEIQYNRRPPHFAQYEQQNQQYSNSSSWRGGGPPRPHRNNDNDGFWRKETYMGNRSSYQNFRGGENRHGYV